MPRNRLVPALTALAMLVVIAAPAWSKSPQSQAPDATMASSGGIEHVANIPYASGTDEEFASFTVTKLSNGATGDPVCATNPDGSCMTDASGATVYETELRDFVFVGSLAINGHVIDITDPTNPTVVANLPCKMNQNDIQIWNNILLQSQDGTGGRCTRPDDSTQTQVTVGFSDISDPRNPRFIGKLTESRGAHNATVHPTQPIVYISNSDLPSTSDVIHIWNFADPTAPVKVKDWTVNEALLFSPHDITFNASGNRAYVASVSHTDIINTSDPLNPTIVAIIPNEGISISHGADPTPDGKYLLVTDELGGGSAPTASPGGPVHVYDISTEAHPQKVGVIGNDCTVVSCDQAAVHISTSHVMRINPDGYTMALGWYEDGLHVIDYSDTRGIATGGTGALTGMGGRTIAWAKMSDSDVWSAKMWQERHPGYVFVNDLNRGFDVFYVPEMGPGFLATGAVHINNPSADDQYSLAETEITEVACSSRPTSQGLDGYVIPIPPALADGQHKLTVSGWSVQDPAPYDLSAYFFDSNCAETGAGLGAGVDPTGVIPAGAAYVSVDLIQGANVRFIATTAKI